MTASFAVYIKPPRITSKLWKVWMRNRDVFMKTYKVNFIPPLLEPILYLLALGFGLGFFIQQIGDVSYATYIAPALLAIAMMNSAFFECTFGSFVRMYYQKTFDAIIATPLSLEDVIAGELLWGATRSIINVAIMFPVIVAFGLVKLPSALLVIPFAFLAGLLFAALGMCFTAIAPNIMTLNYPFYLFITPMFLFSGTFFPLSILPLPIRVIAISALPLTHVVSISRAATLASFEVFQLYGLVWIIAVTIPLFIISINLMKKKLIT